MEVRLNRDKNAWRYRTQENWRDAYASRSGLQKEKNRIERRVGREIDSSGENFRSGRRIERLDEEQKIWREGDGRTSDFLRIEVREAPTRFECRL